MRQAKPINERFDTKYVPVPESGCWLWTGSVDQNGYGRIGGYDENGKYRPLIATRVSLAIHGRPVPAGMDACHKCDTPACVNPDHLFIGTHKANGQDMVAKGRATQGGHLRNRSVCANGHQLSGENLGTRSDGQGRACRACKRESQRRYRVKKSTQQSQEANR